MTENKYDREAAERQAAWIAEARKLGTEAGENAAAWWEGSNPPGPKQAQRVLDAIADGDPEIMDVLPRPDLSGEWADEPTPRSLFEDVTGADAHAEASWNWDAYHATVDELCSAWEDGAADAVQRAVERQCRAALGLNEMEEARRRRYLETESS